MNCKRPGCRNQVVASGHGRPGRPKTLCSEHSTSRARSASARADLDRYPCGCKKSEQYLMCQQHQNSGRDLKWGDPNQHHPEYESALAKGAHGPVVGADPNTPALLLPGALTLQTPQVAEHLAAKAVIARERGRDRVCGQWLTERYTHNGAQIPVIGQWDLTDRWEPVTSDEWRQVTTVALVPRQLVTRGPNWPWN